MKAIGEGHGDGLKIDMLAKNTNKSPEGIQADEEHTEPLQEGEVSLCHREVLEVANDTLNDYLGLLSQENSQRRERQRL